MGDLWKMVVAFLCGGGGLAIINIIQERWKWKHDRKATVEDREAAKDEKLDKIEDKLTKVQEKLDALEKKDQGNSEAMSYVLLDRIIYIGQSYIRKGEVSFDDRRRLRDMHSVYHNLGGNGDADFIMHAVDELPLKP